MFGVTSIWDGGNDGIHIDDWVSYDEMAAKYDPAKLKYGYNTIDGEEIYFIPNPALGLWIDKERFNA